MKAPTIDVCRGAGCGKIDSLDPSTSLCVACRAKLRPRCEECNRLGRLCAAHQPSLELRLAASLRPTALALAVAVAAMSPVERVLVTGSLSDALAYAVAAGDQDERPTNVPPRGVS